MKEKTPSQKRRQLVVRAFLLQHNTNYTELAREYGCSPSHMRVVLLGERGSAPIQQFLKKKGWGNET